MTSAPSNKSRLLNLILIMVTVVIFSTAAAISILFDASFEEQRSRLVDLVKRQARTFESMVILDSAHEEHGHSKESRAKSIDFIQKAHSKHKSFSTGLELILAQKSGTNVTFLMSHRETDHTTPPSIEISSIMDRPIQRAVAGKSGTMVGPDFRGQTVLAAYEPVRGLNLGLVAKIDMAATGIGMSDDELKMAMEKFGQVRREKGIDNEGTGLGLPLAKSLIEAHGGKMNIHSIVGQGTSVAVTIPKDRILSKIPRQADGLG
jgi:light-regulated signal transduction histidine kinase (bacteriophytochrome)